MSSTKHITRNISVSTLDRYAEQVRRDYNVPGLAISIVKDGEIIFAKGYGIRKLGDSQAVTENTLFGIASISKSFTALALAMLVDDGLLKWDDPVTKYIPSFQLFDSYATREFTVLDLLVHRSGLATVSGGTVWYGTDYSRDEIIRRIRYLKPVSSFRSEYAYQNIMYLVAGQIIPAVTGKSWDKFIEARIFNPLGMNTTNTSIKAFDAQSNVAQPHAIVNGKLQAIAARNHDNVGPAASINTSAVELAAYVCLLLNGGQYKGQQLFSAEIAQDLWTPHTVVPLSNDYPVAYKMFMPQFHNAYALGWFSQDYRGTHKKMVHSGGIDGLRSLATMIPKEKLGVIVLANNESPAIGVMTSIILALESKLSVSDWYAPVLEMWGKRKAQFDEKIRKIEAERILNTRPSFTLEKYAGRYVSELYGDIEVKFDGAGLSLHFSHTASFIADLTHWHFDTFQLKWQDPVIPDGLLTFVIDSHGHPAEIQLNQSNLLDVDFSELHPIRRVS